MPTAGLTRMTGETSSIVVIALIAGPLIAALATLRDRRGSDPERFRALKWRIFLFWLAGLYGTFAAFAVLLALEAGVLALVLGMAPLALAFILKPEAGALSGEGPAGDRRAKVAALATVVVAVAIVVVLEPALGSWAYVSAAAFAALPLAWVERDPQGGWRSLVRTYLVVLGVLLGIVGLILLAERMGLSV